jgi:flagellar export protein FliJ
VKKFEFPLASVAKWSHQKLSVEQLALSRLGKEIDSVDKGLQELREKVADGQSTLQAQAVLTGGELQTLTRFVQKLAVDRNHLQRIRQGLVAREEAQRRRVVTEHRKVKLLDNLHERRRQEWSLELTKEEDALASDLFLAKLARDLRRTQTAPQTHDNMPWQS